MLDFSSLCVFKYVLKLVASEQSYTGHLLDFPHCSALCVFKCLLKLPALQSLWLHLFNFSPCLKSHWLHLFDFFSNVRFQMYQPELIQSHTGRTCFIFVHGAFSNVSSNCLLLSHFGCIILTFIRV